MSFYEEVLAIFRKKPDPELAWWPKDTRSEISPGLRVQMESWYKEKPSYPIEVQLPLCGNCGKVAARCPCEARFTLPLPDLRFLPDPPITPVNVCYEKYSGLNELPAPPYDVSQSTGWAREQYERYPVARLITECSSFHELNRLVLNDYRIL